MLNRLVLAALIVAGIGGQLDAQKGGFLGLGRGKPEFQLFRDPAGRISFEYPKDWRPVTVGASTEVMVTFTQKDGDAALVVERFRLNLPTSKDDLTDPFVRAQTDLLQQRHTRATNIVGKVVDLKDLRMIVFDYNRPGVDRPEHARQYSIPSGTEDLYLLTCSAATDKFPKYDAICSRVAESFKFVTATPQGHER